MTITECDIVNNAPKTFKGCYVDENGTVFYTNSETRRVSDIDLILRLQSFIRRHRFSIRSTEADKEKIQVEIDKLLGNEDEY